MIVRVKAGSRKGPLVEEWADGAIIVYVRERAVDGAANAAVIEALARHLRVPKSTVEIVRGKRSSVKTVRVH